MYNYIVEIPRGTHPKLEIQPKQYLNPIVQDRYDSLTFVTNAVLDSKTEALDLYLTLILTIMVLSLRPGKTLSLLTLGRVLLVTKILWTSLI